MASQSLSGQVTDEVGDEFTTIRVTSTQVPAPFFVVNHTLGLPGPVLIGTHNQPIAFEVKSTGMRGFVTSLFFTGRTAPGEDERPIEVTSLNSFDPTSMDQETTLRLDRWSDSDRELLLGSELAGARDGTFTTAGNRSMVKLSVAPLLTVHAGGVEWNGAGPRDVSRADFDVLAQRMARYQPGQVLTKLADRDLQRLRARMQKLADTDSSIGGDAEAEGASARWGIREGGGAMAASMESATEAPRKAGKASLVRGAPLPAVARPIRLQYFETGAESAFQIALFACPKDSFDAFKSSIPAAAAR